MGTTLTGTTPQTTYDSLIKVTDNGPLGGSLKTLTDGLGNDSALALSTGAASVTGTLAVSSNLTVDTDTLFVDAANNRVGIGTTSNYSFNDDAKLAVANTAGNSTISIVSSTSGIGYLAFADGTSGTDRYTGSINYNHSTNAMTLHTNAGNERMIITDTGAVGIGTSSPSELLHLSTTLAGSTGVGTAIQITSGGAGGDQAFIGVNKGAGNGLEISVENRDIIFNTGATTPFGGTERVRITSAGNVGIGTSTPATTLDVNGDIKTSGNILLLSTGGIYFDNAASKYLDDYEVGTWTMGISFGGASVGVTYSTNTGTYTKIGRQVTVNGLLQLSSKGSSTGTALITGLPFIIANSNSNYSAPTLSVGSVTFANQIQGESTIGSTTILLNETTELGVTTSLTNADFANTSYVIVSFTYFV